MKSRTGFYPPMSGHKKKPFLLIVETNGCSSDHVLTYPCLPSWEGPDSSGVLDVVHVYLNPRSLAVGDRRITGVYRPLAWLHVQCEIQSQQNEMEK